MNNNNKGRASVQIYCKAILTPAKPKTHHISEQSIKTIETI